MAMPGIRPISMAPPPSPPRPATYQIDAPDGTWGPANVGTYTATMQFEEVSDIYDNYVPAGVLGWFDISVESDTTPPTATD